MNFDIIALVAEILEPISNRGIPVQEGWYDKNLGDTHITFFLYLELPELASDDEVTAYSHNIQVDIWTLDSLEGNNLKNEARSLLQENNFKFDSGNDQFETDTKIYHKAMRFSYLEDLES